MLPLLRERHPAAFDVAELERQVLRCGTDDLHSYKISRRRSKVADSNSWFARVLKGRPIQPARPTIQFNINSRMYGHRDRVAIPTPYDPVPSISMEKEKQVINIPPIVPL